MVAFTCFGLYLLSVCQRMSAARPPAAHVGHWLWVFYLLPVLVVVVGILADRPRTNAEERKTPLRRVARGGSENGPKPDRPQDPPR